MKISLACKLDNYSAFDFIKAIVNIKQIEEIKVFRDNKGIVGKKIIYYTPKIQKPMLLKNLCKLLQMLFILSLDTKLLIGIYEIPHGALAFMVGKIKKIPVVICIIGNPDYKKKRKALWKLAMYFILKRVDAVTSTGNKSKEILINNGVNPNKIYILPNSINTNYFLPNPCKKVYDIISVGRLSPEKEFIKFLDIVKILKEKLPKIKVGIAGKGPEKGKLQKKIKELSLENNVDLLGYIKNVARFYNSGKIFVSCSSTEGLPRAVIEAMACGVPCVISNIGDIEDLVKNEENGFLVDDYSNKDEFVNKIMLLLSDRNLYNHFSIKSIIYAKENYSYQAAIYVWENIIKCTIQEKNE